MKILFLTIAIFLTHIIYAQVVYRPATAPYNLLGAYSNTHSSLFATNGNIATIALQKHSQIGIFSERRFMLEEISFHKAALMLTTKGGNIGVEANYLGNQTFNHTKVALNYGMQLSKVLFLGAQLNYNNVQLQEYGNDATPGYAMGLIFKFNDKLKAGLQTENPITIKYGEKKLEELPSVYSFGMGYDVSEQLSISAEVEKEVDYPINVNAGIKYFPAEQVSVQLGMATYTGMIYGGVGVYLKNFNIDFLTSYHPQLGFSPGLQLVYNFSKQNNE